MLVISIPPRAEPLRRSGGLAFWVLLSMAVVVLGFGAVLLSRSQVLHARGVEVTGASHLSRAEIVAAAGVSRATNVMWLDEGAAERRLETDPWIADADVHVAFPWTIEIAIIERRPVAVADDGGLQMLVAADGTALGPPGRTRGLPRIMLPPHVTRDGGGQSPRGAALALGSMDPELRAQVASVTVFVGGSMDLRLRGGIAVHYGPPIEPARKAEVLAAILEWARAQGEGMSEVSVVAPDAPAVRLAA